VNPLVLAIGTGSLLVLAIGYLAYRISTSKSDPDSLAGLGREFWFPDGALVSADLTPGQEVAIALPASPRIVLMVRYCVRVDQYALRIVLDVKRTDASGGQCEVIGERCIGEIMPSGQLPVLRGDGARHFREGHVEEWATQVLARIPEGGAGTIRVRLEGAALAATLFARVLPP
jgi:hypothetical protein